MRGTYQFTDPNVIDATVTLTTSVKNWRRIAEHLGEAKDRHYGAIDELLRPLRDLITQAEQRFNNREPPSRDGDGVGK